jgi:DNA-binding transcriptional LysR family regulator
MSGDLKQGKDLFRGQISGIDLRLLRVFRKVVDCGGFTAAEVSLNKSKSAISTDIADLEQRLQVRLCERGRGGFAVTPQGGQIYHAIVDLLADIEGFRDKVNRARQRLSGELVVYATDNIITHGQSPLVRTFGTFARQNPEVFLTLKSAPAGEIQQAILDGRAGLGISILERHVSSFELIPLFDELLLLYCGRGHPLYDMPEEKLTLDQISSFKLIEIRTIGDPDFADLVHRHFAFVARSSSIDARVIMILSDEFLGFLPPQYAEPWVSRGEMRAIMPEVLRTSNPFHAIFNRAAPPNLLVDEFRNILLAEYGVAEGGARDAEPAIEAGPGKQRQRA